MKKCFLLLALLMLVLIPAAKPAAAIDSGGWSYELLDDGNAEITGYKGTDVDVTVPGSLDGHTVVSIGTDAFRENTNIISIHFADSIFTIGEQAFNGCENLASISLPKNLQTIKVGAFQANPSLVSITFPDTLTSIEAFAFNHTGLVSVDLPGSLNSIGQNPFMGCDNLLSFNISLDNQKFKIVNHALYNSETKTLIAYPGGLSDQTYEIPEGTSTIGYGAFYMNKALTNVVIPGSVTTIDGWAFFGTKLPNIEIPEGVTTINTYAFHRCSNLKRVSLPDSLTTMAENPFDMCPNLEAFEISAEHPVYEVVDSVLIDKKAHKLISAPAASLPASYRIPEGVTSIGNFAFYDTELTTVEIPEGVISIGDFAFNGCGDLMSVSLPSSLKSIGKAAFFSSGLQYVEIPEGVSSIGDAAFGRCENLTSVKLPDSLRFIAMRAFDYTGLRHVEIPEGVIEIGEQAFWNCESLSSVTIPESVTFIGDEAFLGTPLTSVNVTAGSYAEKWAQENGLECVYP